MDSSKAALLAVATLFGMLILAQSEGARATALSLRPRKPAASYVRCETVRIESDAAAVSTPAAPSAVTAWRQP